MKFVSSNFCIGVKFLRMKVNIYYINVIYIHIREKQIDVEMPYVKK